jgi:hypothetical protein
MCNYGSRRFGVQSEARRAATRAARADESGVFIGPTRTYKVHPRWRLTDRWESNEVRVVRALVGRDCPPLARYYRVVDYPSGTVLFAMETLPEEPGPELDYESIRALYDAALEVLRGLGVEVDLWSDYRPRHVRLNRRGEPRIFDLEGPDA